MFKPQKTRNLGKYAFVTMLVGGLTFLWIYSRLSESLNLQTLATLQQTISRVGFTVWEKNHTHRASCFHFPKVSLRRDRLLAVRRSDRGSGKLESELHDHANSSW